MPTSIYANLILISIFAVSRFVLLFLALHSFRQGSDDQSWGWNLVDNHLLHNGETQGSYPRLNNAPKYQMGERIRVILDCEQRTLSFEKNSEFLGVAFTGERLSNSFTK